MFNNIPMQTPLRILKNVFGYDTFHGAQADIIDYAISGGSALVLMPTGSGKSLCYQIPSIARDGIGLVVSPLIALMDDQVAGLKQLGIRAACLHSGIDPSIKAGIYDDIRNNALDLLYVAPERLMMPDFLELLDNTQLSLLAIDEAHCISQWGHDFRPEYRQLANLRRRWPDVPCLAVTATADEPTRADIQTQLSLPKIYVGGFDRPNIHYSVGIKSNPRSQLLSFLKSQEKDSSGIVYCLSRKKVDETAAWLKEQGYNAHPYHAGLDTNVRAANQNIFIKNDGVIVVATIAFGMGINKPDVRFVAHLDLPKNIEAYYQETGRAGRDGLPANAWMVYGMQDVALQQQMIEESESPSDQKRIERQKLTALLGYCEAAGCRRQVLLRYFGSQGEPCNNCDTCAAPPQTFDATIPAQKILSCIYRTDQRFGAHYVIDVLMGSDDERIRKFGHDTLSVYGIGTDLTHKEWQGIIRQLASLGYLRTDMMNHGALKITELGAAFLKDKTSLALRVDAKPVDPIRTAARNKANTLLENDEDRALFANLKAIRLQIAKEQNVPPYVIFHDRTLLEMVTQKPSTLTEMAGISGIGQTKLEKYGTEFLQALQG